MKPTTRRAVRKLARATSSVCSPCASDKPDRCCSPTFCDIADAQARLAGHVQVQVGGGSPVKFLGPNGCVMPPEYRPGYTGFVCPERLTPKLDKRRRQLFASVDQDETLNAMLRLGQDRSETFLFNELKGKK